MKASKVGKPSKGLKNCIQYILNPGKTEDLWIGGNSGSTAEEVYQTMMETKNEYDKLDGRQGYHYILSFMPGETDEKTAYLIVKEFCERYFGDNYDHVFAIHTDKAHLHGHIVFNSVGRIDGLKYRYEKGDWEKYIQPITDELCRKYGLSELRFEKGKKKGRSRAEYERERNQKLTWRDFVKADIDECIAKSHSYEEFLRAMMEKYQIHEGKSKNRKSYITIRWGDKRGERKRIYEEYNGEKNPLGVGYSLTDIKQRIENRDVKLTRTITPFHLPPQVKTMSCSVRLTIHRTYYSRYQKTYITRLWKIQRIRSPLEVSSWKVRKDIMQVDKLLGDIQFLVGNNLRTVNELKAYQQHTEYAVKELRREKYKEADRFTPQEIRVIERYEKLKKEMFLESDNDAYEKLEDELEDLESRFPAAELTKDYHESQKNQKKLEKEIRLIQKEYKRATRLCEEIPKPVLKREKKKVWKNNNILRPR